MGDGEEEEDEEEDEEVEEKEAEEDAEEDDEEDERGGEDRDEEGAGVEKGRMRKTYVVPGLRLLTLIRVAAVFTVE